VAGMTRFRLPITSRPWSLIPSVVVGAVALILLYGAYVSLTSTQAVNIVTGAPGG
jgi:hypothetical protein